MVTATMNDRDPDKRLKYAEAREILVEMGIIHDAVQHINEASCQAEAFYYSLSLCDGYVMVLW